MWDPNFAMISAHIKYGPDEWRVTSEASPVRSDVVLTPLLHTVHLADDHRRFATFDACLLSAVPVRFGRCAIVRLRLAALAAFLMFLRAARR